MKISYEERDYLKTTINHIVARRESITSLDIMKELTEHYERAWGLIVQANPTNDHQTFFLQTVIPDLYYNNDTEPDRVWTKIKREYDCYHCDRTFADMPIIRRLDRFGHLFCDDRCYDTYYQFADLAGVDDDESEAYYYEYTEYRALHNRFVMKWDREMKAPTETARAQRDMIQKLADFVSDIDQIYEQAATVSGGDDGFFSAEIARIAAGIYGLMQEILTWRLDLVMAYWIHHWKTELDTRASGEGAYVKSTIVMDEMEQMYVFYRDHLPDGEHVERRFFQLMRRMLDWRPQRKRLYYGFGLERKFALREDDDDAKGMKTILKQIEQETGFRLSTSTSKDWSNPDWFYRRDLEWHENDWDYSWAFKEEAARDRIYSQLKPFFERADLAKYLMHWDDDDVERPFRLVTFDVYPCECGCNNSLTRSIDDCFHQEKTDGWYVCYLPYTENLLEPMIDDVDDPDPYGSWGSLWYIQTRRGYRAAGEAAPMGAYSEWEKEQLGWL